MITNRSPPENTGGHETHAVSLDTAFELLSDARRRRLITDLVDADLRSVTELVHPSDSAEYQLDESVLYHVHLPKLHDAGVIEWDRETGTVRRGPWFEDVEVLTDLLRSNQHALPGSWF